MYGSRLWQNRAHSALEVGIAREPDAFVFLELIAEEMQRANHAEGPEITPGKSGYVNTEAFFRSF